MKNQHFSSLKGLFIMALCLMISATAMSQNKPPKEKPVKDTILANKTFNVALTNMMGKKGDKAKDIEDVFEFKAGKLKSKFFESEGYRAAEYKVSLDMPEDAEPTDSKSYAFESEAKNADGLTLKITGTWDGEEFSGTAMILKKEKEKGEYVFKGTLKEKKKKK